ncbi:MAG TPA: bifunctional glycosyltransferase/class I SAM-dependent methyltransferase [Tepidisphaeraceae bacterium]
MDSDSQQHGRILIFVVAYGAEQLIASTLDRIPRELFDSPRVYFLVIDDASSDKTATVAGNWVNQHGYRNVTVLRNPANQGYGGNQKLGYRLALEWGFDFVILLHGDGQYAPELLPEFIRAWDQTDNDVILGSRMQSLASARKGGMPFYKLIGNRILTKIQNRLAGSNLSEWHTGYRGYSARLLRTVPFEINTGDFHFDTEILLQAIYVGAKFTEFPIPTHYGGEVCHVNGLDYARNVIIETFRFRMHRSGMLCSLKYRDLEPINYRSKTGMAYTSHSMALAEVKRLHPHTILDIGCGPGFVARECEKLGAKVTGLDFRAPLPEMMSEFQKLDLESNTLPVDPFDYDCVLMLDVIEHLGEPEHFLLAMRNNSRAMRDNTRLILTTPNVTFFLVRLNLLLGRFNYAQRGILDITHKRLFTKTSLRTALRDCGYVIEKMRAVPPPGQVVGGTLGKILGKIFPVLARIWPRMFGFQWLVVCHPRPGIHHLLAAAERNVPGPFSIEMNNSSAKPAEHVA